MGKLRIGQKATRTGTLLIGMRHSRIAKQLAPYGFSAETLEEGWDLFMKVTGQRLGKVLSTPVKQPGIVSEVDAFEDHWFPLVKIMLDRHHPEASDHLFLNLSREDGKPATFTVAMFLQRLEDMEKGEEPYGPEGPKVREYLKSRGLTEDIVSQVAADMDRLQTPQEEITTLDFDEEALAKAEDDMWAFYLEWSAIARRVITDGNLLRVLGFKKRRSGRTPQPPVVVETERALPSNPEPMALPAE